MSAGCLDLGSNEDHTRPPHTKTLSFCSTSLFFWSSSRWAMCPNRESLEHINWHISVHAASHSCHQCQSTEENWKYWLQPSPTATGPYLLDVPTPAETDVCGASVTNEVHFYQKGVNVSTLRMMWIHAQPTTFSLFTCHSKIFSQVQFVIHWINVETNPKL